MPCDVRFDEKEGIVCISHTEPLIKEDHYAAWKAALKLCHQHECHKVLVDMQSLMTHVFTTLESYIFGEMVANTPGHFCIAHVLPESGQVRKNTLFVSTVEINRGKLTREFDSLEEAINWLTAQK